MDGIRRRGKVRNKSWHVYLLVVSWFLIPAVAHLDSCSPITLTHLEFHWEGWEYFHSRVIAKTSPLDFSLLFFLSLSLPGHSFLSLRLALLSSWTFSVSFVIFPPPFYRWTLFWRSRFRIPLSSIPTCLSVGLPEEFLAYDYPLMFHLNTQTHT